MCVLNGKMTLQLLSLFCFYLCTVSAVRPSGQAICAEDTFPCGNGYCIPLIEVCDGEDNCPDASDEEMCDEEKTPLLAAMEAALFLLTRRNIWYDFTPRALTALGFVEKYVPIAEEAKKEMTRELEDKLLKLLRDKGVGNIKVNVLALYINALYATCADPREFQSMDLVKLLRIRMDNTPKSEFSYPGVYLALCIARDTRLEDFTQLIKIYDNSRLLTGTRALAIITMAACRGQATEIYYYQMQKRAEDFVQRYQDADVGIYSKGMIYQALNAWKYDTTSLQKKLVSLQLSDGSFQDLLGTYAVIPALINESLADLQCKSRKYYTRPKSIFGELLQSEKRMEFEIEIPYGLNIGNHSITIPWLRKESLYVMMVLAQEKNDLFQFTFDEVAGSGKRIASIANIHNDPEAGMLWTLYKKRSSTKETIVDNDSIDFVFPEDGEKYIFRLRAEI